MKLLSKQSFEEIRRWIYRNARPLELGLWQYHFENGSKETVLLILLNYQNKDGGFGNAIDPDNYNPESSPHSTLVAIGILRQIEFFDTSHPIYQGIFKFLESTEFKADYGWFFTIPSNNDHPHAIWWDYSREDNLFQSTGITANLSGFILRYGNKESKLYEMAAMYKKLLLEKLNTIDNFGDMGVAGLCDLLEDLEAAGLTEDNDYICLRDKIHGIVRNKIQSEPDNFMAQPIEFVHSPDSRFYAEYKEEVEAALDNMLGRRPAMGVWDIPWNWYNGDKYIKAFAISENWWKAAKAIEKLLLLRSFNRLA